LKAWRQGRHRTPGIKIESLALEDLGQAETVIIDKDAATIIEGAGTSQAIAARVKARRAFFGRHATSQSF